MKETMKLARQIIWRYRHETPLGNQPHMIAHEADEAIERIDQALAKQEQGEPVAWGMQNDDGKIYDCITPEEHKRQEGEYTVPLYTTAQSLEWIGLTAEQISIIEHEVYSRTVQKGKHMSVFITQFAKAIDSALKELNNGS